jgi:amino acid adenylation domain-containing protein
MDDRATRVAGLSPAKQALLALRRERDARSRPEPAARIPHVPGRASAPLSFAQERFWFLHQLDPGGSVLNLSRAYRLRGALDRAAIERALAEVVARHEVLRAVVAIDDDGRPIQVAGGSPPIVLETADVSHLPAGERDPAAQRLHAETVLRPYDLTRGPLLRMLLVRLDDDEHLLVIGMHHVVGDAWSFATLLGDFAAVHDAVRAGRPWQLPELTIQYADFAAWQRERVDSGCLDGELDYWRRTLGGRLPEALLPADRPYPVKRTYRGTREHLRLSPSLSAALTALGRREGASTFMILLAGLQALLHRHTGEEDVTLGTPIALRSRMELEPLVGCLLNTLVLRTDLSGALTFRELLRRARATALGAYEHQEVPIERVLADVRPMRQGSRTPLFQVMLNMHDVPHGFALSGLRVEPVAAARAGAMFDMTLYFRHHDDGALALTLSYSRDLFDGERARDVLAQLAGLLEQAARDPDRRLAALSLLTPAARVALPDPRETLDASWHGAVHEGFARQARRIPDRIAVEDRAGAWTYGELDASSARIAHRLRADGVGAESVVAVYAHRSAPLVAALLGVLRAGAAFTILDPAYPEGRLLDGVAQARPRAWIEIAGAPDPPAALRAFADGLPCRLRLGPGREAAAAGGPALADFPATAPDVAVGPDTLACVTFTSGSTGQPKGVLGLHGSLSHFLPWQAEAFSLGDADRFSMLSGLAHDPIQRDIFTALWVGGTICVPEPDRIMTPGWLAEWARRTGVTVMQLTPAMLQLLVETAPEGTGSRLDGLRRVFTVGDVLTRRDVTRLRELAPAAVHVNYYGATETQRALGYFQVPDGDAAGRDVVPLGRGLPGAQLLVLNRAGTLAGVGELGEIHVRSPHLARGYLDDDGLTRERFLVNPFTGRRDDRMYRTGDLGRYRADGVVEFAGRADRQVQVRGFRVELGEVEAALGAHPDVADAAVVAREESPGDMRLVAYVVSPAAVRPAELRRFLGERVPAHMVPAWFVTVDALPLTPNGKVDRAALPAPGRSWLDTGEPFVTPRDPLETELAGLWAEILGVERVGVTQSFFDLGGHSLLALRLSVQVHRRLGRRLALASLFRAPTVEQQAALLRDHVEPAERRALVAIQPRGDNPPLFCVPGHAGTVLCFQELARRLAPDQPLYGLEPRGLGDGRSPRVRVEDMAADYLREIRGLQPGGPYFISGFCFGGLVAFEMAQQLLAGGERVALLALFDARGRVSAKAARGLEPLARRAGRRLAVEYANLRPLPVRDRVAYAWAQGRRLTERLAARVRRLGPPPADADAALVALARAQSAAARAYVARPYPAPVVVFMSQRRHTRHYVDPQFGWGQVVTGRLDVRLVPIAEGTVIQHPDGARAVATDLVERIRRAQLTF